MNCFETETGNGIAVITLGGTCGDPSLLAEELLRLEGDRAVDVIVLKGREGRFCIGRPVEDLNDFGLKEARAYAVRGQRLIKGMRELKKPLISSIDGEAFGPGFEIALASDIILTTKGSSFAFPEVKLGIVPGFGGTQLFTRKIYETFVKYLVFTGDAVSAAEMRERGIVNRVFDTSEELRAYTDELAERMSKRSSFALGLAKETINAGIGMDLDKALLLEQNAFTFSFSSPDKKEGMGAFIEKRRPDFKVRWEDISFEDKE
ncbi:enoyl-CoA hydratase/isomerase family protein [Limisalsivibrio acetivorans]|uniref:enoyl-CoA hydratase/isomerase family protein n=1 Tax=Limisalsivibrio acetivorans TaxID=1304888 RepID=UPI0003B72BD7|nr:enoyl-CoA hydratase/isomerase family protein [Limisalsivibrio acetivorans]